jgi:phage terminase large subunit
MHRFLVLVGGGGSGKSHFIAQMFIIRILAGIARGFKHNIPGLRKTQPAVRHSVFETFKFYIDAWNLQSVTDIKESTMDIYWMGGSRINCGGLDNQEKIKSYEGMTSGWMEETTEFSQMDVTQVNLRMRGAKPTKKQIALSFNPMDQNSFLKELCDDPPDNTVVVQSDYRDNAFLHDAEYEAELEALKEKDINLWRIYARGEWGQLANLIYSNYEKVADSDWPDAFDDVWYGLDLGFTNQTALIECCSLDGEIYERELIYAKGLHTDDIIEQFRELDIDPSACIYADPSAAKEIDLINKAGYNIDKADNSVLSGIRFVRAKHPKIHEDSVNHLDEKKTYKYKEDKDGNVLEAPVKFKDHAQDAERYALFTHLTKDKSDIWFV